MIVIANIIAGVLCLFAFVVAGVFGFPQAIGLLGIGIGIALVGKLPDPWKKIVVGVLVGWGLLVVGIPITWNLIMGRLPFSGEAWDVRHVIEDIRNSERIRVHGYRDIRTFREFADRIEEVEGRRLADEYRHVLQDYEAGRITFEDMTVYDRSLRNRIRFGQSWRKDASDFILQDEYAPPPTKPWYERLWGAAPRVLLWTLGVAAIIGLILGILLKKPQLALASLVGAALVGALFVADATLFRGGETANSASFLPARTLRSGDLVKVAIGTECRPLDVVRDYGVPYNADISFHPEGDHNFIVIRYRGKEYKKVGRSGKFEPPLPSPLSPDPYEVRGNCPQTMTVKVW